MASEPSAPELGQTDIPAPIAAPARMPSGTGREFAIVLIPGWGFDRRIFGPIDFEAPIIDAPAVLPNQFVSALAEELDRLGVESVVLVGWSLGANLALDFAARFPRRVRHIHLLGLRPAYTREEIVAEKASLLRNPEVHLKHFYRRVFIGHQQIWSVFERELLPAYLAAPPTELLVAGLDYLADQRPPRGALATVEATCWHGGRDRIAPLADLLGWLNADPDTPLEVLPTAGHALFLSEDFPAAWHAAMEAIKQEPPQMLRPPTLAPPTARHPAERKAAVRAAFARAAETYDASVNVQPLVIDALTKLLPKTKAKSILEIGCGTGRFTTRLAGCYPRSTIQAIDFCPQMIEVAMRKWSGSAVDWLVADGETFEPPPGTRFDLVTSSGALQWFDDLGAALARMRTWLTPHGHLVFAIFGPQTFAELRRVWHAVSDHPPELPAARFADAPKLQALLRPHFPKLSIDRRTFTQSHPSLLDLLRHLHSTGANGGAWRGLLVPATIRKLELEYRARYGAIVASYEVFFCLAQG